MKNPIENYRLLKKLVVFEKYESSNLVIKYDFTSVYLKN